MEPQERQATERKASHVATSAVAFDVFGLSHRGLIQPENQDCYLVLRFGRSLETLLTNLPEGHIPRRSDETGYAMLVADGMGGDHRGGIASRVALSLLVGLALDVPDWMFGKSEANADEVMHRTEALIRKVNSALLNSGRSLPSLHGMSTTLTGVRSFGEELILAHVGDSRAYLLRHGHMHRLTSDHTYSQVLVGSGVVPPTHPGLDQYRNVLLNALGGDVKAISVDMDRVQLMDGDCLLLCTDGLTEMLSDDEITRTLLQADSPAVNCQALVDRALQRGGNDNVTAVVARYRI